jgi:peptidoglycan/xylan/chitin deacetylase (PgdA/CDA1 family)
MATAGGAGTAGVTGSGGITGTGGTTSTGGNTGTGGTPGTGGGTASPLGASGYPPAGTSGQAQPTGSGTTVTVLDWGNFKTAVSFTFDDANQSQLDNYTALQAENDQGNNVRYTFYLITGKSQASKYGQAQKDGHELANHTKSHSSDATTTDIQAAQDFLKSTYGITSYDIAAPNGASSYSTVVPSMKEFLTNRSPNNSGGMSPTDAPSSRQWSLPCIIPGTGDPASTMESSISAAISGGKWITFLVHGFNTPASDQSEGAYQPVSITEFTSTVSWAKAQGTIWIDTVENVSAYWIAEYNFKKLTPTASGTDKTWTWKTSDFNAPFPPGKYLRVTTDGGTLKQGSTVLTWDDHGYYEVSLDAGTLTLSP